MAEATVDITVRVTADTTTAADEKLVSFGRSICLQGRTILESRTGRTITETDVKNATPAQLKKGVTILAQDYLESLAFTWDAGQKEYDRFDMSEVEEEFIP